MTVDSDEQRGQRWWTEPSRRQLPVLSLPPSLLRPGYLFIFFQGKSLPLFYCSRGNHSLSFIAAGKITPSSRHFLTRFHQQLIGVTPFAELGH